MPGKSQIADRIAARGPSKAAAAAAVEAVLDEITAALAAGERVTLTGFGTFEATGRAARTGRNPRTGEALEVAATTVARFHPGATLRSRVAAGAGGPLGSVADLTSLQGLAASPEPPARVAVEAQPAPSSRAKPSAKPSSAMKASAKVKAKAEAKKAEVKKRADAAKKADAKKRAAAKKADAKAAAKKAGAKASK